MSATAPEYPTPAFLAAREKHLRAIGREDLLDIRAVRRHLRRWAADQLSGTEYLDFLLSQEDS